MFAALLVSLLWIVPGIVGQTVRLAGDSTMAKGGGGSGTDGEEHSSCTSHFGVITVLVHRLGSILGSIPFLASR